MDKETPALGVSKVVDYSNYTVFKIDCECSDARHAHLIEVEFEPDVKMVTVSISTESSTDYWTEYLTQHNDNLKSNFMYYLRWNIAYAFNEGVRRLKIAKDALIYGIIKRESHVLLSEKRLVNYIGVLEQALEKIREQNKPNVDNSSSDSSPTTVLMEESSGVGITEIDKTA